MPDRKNILLITSDQQHWNTIGRYFDEVRTPNLDRLCATGTDFRRAYCPNPTCTPSRASIITGQYPSRHGAWSLGTKLPESCPTLGDALRPLGYDCSLIGKAHFQPLRSTPEFSSLESYPILRDLDFWRGFHGPFYGFNHVELARNHTDEAHVGQHYALWMEEKGLANWEDHFENTWCEHDFSGGKAKNPAQRHHWTLPEQFHSNPWITERAIARMEHCRAGDQPFFCWASYFDPHPSYLVPEPWASMYDPKDVTVPQATPGEHDKNPPHFQKTQEEHPDFSDLYEDGQAIHGYHSHLREPATLAKDIAVYYGMISMLDHYVGKLLDYLEATDQRENTLVVFTTDHGHFYGQHGLIAKGGFHYEDLIRVPFIVSQPGTIPENTTSEAIQSLVDLPRSFLSAIGEEAPLTMQGVDQFPVWRGHQRAAREAAIVEFRHQPSTIHQRTLVERRYKLTTYCQRSYGELFDLVEDPLETNNRWDDPAAAGLKSELLQSLVHQQMAEEPIWMPRIAPA